MLEALWATVGFLAGWVVRGLSRRETRVADLRAALDDASSTLSAEVARRKRMEDEIKQLEEFRQFMEWYLHTSETTRERGDSHG